MSLNGTFHILFEPSDKPRVDFMYYRGWAFDTINGVCRLAPGVNGAPRPRLGPCLADSACLEASYGSAGLDDA